MKSLPGIVLYLFFCAVVRAEPMPGELTVLLPGGVPLELVWIEPGSFIMGTTEAQKAFMDSLRSREGPTSYIARYGAAEWPAHQVTITHGFYLGKYEVTQAQWEAVMGTRPWDTTRFRIGPDKPAVAMSWFDTQEFMVRLGRLAGGVYRLPTEAEWEYACRAGTQTLWFSGNDPFRVKDYVVGLALVRQQGTPWEAVRPNPWGLYHMSASVAEWVLDGGQPYTPEPQVDPVGSVPRSEEDPAMTRGGTSGDAWRSGDELIWHCRCGDRFPDVPTASSEAPWVGFRVLREATLLPTPVEEAGWGQIKRRNREEK